MQKDKAFTEIRKDRIENVTLALTLDTRRPTDKLPVAVRVNKERKTIYYRTGLRCTLDEWEKISKSAKRGINFEIKKSQIAIYDKVKANVDYLLRENSFNFDNLKSSLTGEKSSNFSIFWKDFADSKKVGTRKSYLNALNSFSSAVGTNIDFSSVSQLMIEKWKSKMERNGLSNTTQGIYFRACRAVVNDCIRQGLIKRNQYPFGRGKVIIRRGRSRKDEFLDVSTIKKLMRFEPPEEWLKGYADAVVEAINFWMFSYLGNGLNLADIAQLKYEKHYFESGKTELKFIREKTKDTTDEDVEIIIPIIPEVQKILDNYGDVPEPDNFVFPQILNGETDPFRIKDIVTQHNSNIRSRIQVACKILGIEKNLSMTWARHSFATNLTIAGVSERYISQAMGHSTKKSITQGYIGLFPPEKRMKFNKMLLEE
ncbi:tyrosine-type recombinase/integrase [Prolixibacter denitrificans]|uniref:Integrase n=1 Tax=Prolixibacter denitrificans TaxID=1541063 RepID=A0A2P8CJV3_9BACT|nr:phage integrase SAM-like domain-containing protein [Prolixibacter denitrificans]PSK85249.1 site-specific recombinase XerD [Prolixibacter denitrificans]GET19871.1 integrase [Prolixibacter denitrificans]